MSETLKPCPFCGGKPYVTNYETESLWSHDQVVYTQVACEDCDIQFATEPGHEKQSAELWNTRPDDNRWRSVAEQAEKALRNTIGWTHRAIDLEVSGSMQEAATRQVKEAEAALSAFDSLRKEGL